LRILRWALFGLGGLGVPMTLLPFVPSNQSAIRIWDLMLQSSDARPRAIASVGASCDDGESGKSRVDTA
jgi:hypothetical protein